MGPKLLVISASLQRHACEVLAAVAGCTLGAGGLGCAEVAPPAPGAGGTLLGSAGLGDCRVGSRRGIQVGATVWTEL